MKKFWNWVRNDGGERVLRLDGPIDEDNFWGDEITPKAFRDELEAEEGDVTVWICSPGGNVFAAAEIYTMLCDHKGKVTVKIDSIAASAASVVAMAGDRVLMSPVAMLFVHDPMTIAMGNTKDMEKAIGTLNEIKESIINAYQRKTGLSRNKISRLMEDETWLNAHKAVELGFADEILFAKEKREDETDEKAGKPDRPEGEKGNGEKETEDCWQPYSTKAMGQRVLNRLVSAIPETDNAVESSGNDTEETLVPEKGVIGKEYGNAEQKPVSENNNGQQDGESESDEPQPSNDLVIGTDGRTKDGSMPYELLRQQLEFLK